MWIGIGMQVAETPTYPVMCRFLLFVALCDHNPPMLQTDRGMSRSQHKHDMLCDTPCRAKNCVALLCLARKHARPILTTEGTTKAQVSHFNITSWWICKLMLLLFPENTSYYDKVNYTYTLTTVLLLFWNMSGTTQVSRYQKGKTRTVKTNLDLLEQEIVSGSGICWAICKSAPHHR